MTACGSAGMSSRRPCPSRSRPSRAGRRKLRRSAQHCRANGAASSVQYWRSRRQQRITLSHWPILDEKASAVAKCDHLLRLVAEIFVDRFRGARADGETIVVAHENAPGGQSWVEEVDAIPRRLVDIDIDVHKRE